jgi:hypothetical protein
VERCAKEITSGITASFDNQDRGTAGGTGEAGCEEATCRSSCDDLLEARKWESFSI